MPGCKEGDMAVVLDAIGSPELVGAFVKVVKKVPMGFVMQGVLPSLVNGGSSQRATSNSTFIVSNKEYGHWLHGDVRLQPIRPPSLKETTETTKELEHDFN